MHGEFPNTMLKMSIQFKLCAFMARWVCISPTPFVFCQNAGNGFLFQKYAFAGGLVAVEMMQLMFARNLSSFSLVLLLESLHVNMWHHFTLKV